MISEKYYEVSLGYLHSIEGLIDNINQKLDSVVGVGVNTKSVASSDKNRDIQTGGINPDSVKSISDKSKKSDIKLAESMTKLIKSIDEYKGANTDTLVKDLSKIIDVISDIPEEAEKGFSVISKGIRGVVTTLILFTPMIIAALPAAGLFAFMLSKLSSAIHGFIDGVGRTLPFMLITSIAIYMFIRLVKMLVDSIDEGYRVAMIQMSLSVALLGAAIVGFAISVSAASGYMAGSSNILGFFMLIAAIKLSVRTIEKMSENPRELLMKTLSVGAVALAMLSFAGSMYLINEMWDNSVIVTMIKLNLVLAMTMMFFNRVRQNVALVKDGAISTGYMSAALTAFYGAMYGSSLLFKEFFEEIPGMIMSLGMFFTAMLMVGKAKTSITDGAVSLLIMSLGISAFAGSIILLSMVDATEQVVAFAFQLSVMGAAMVILGSLRKQVMKSLLAMTAIASVVAAFTAIVMGIGNIMSNPMAIIAMAAIPVTITALVFVFRHVSNNIKGVLKGAVGVAVISLALATMIPVLVASSISIVGSVNILLIALSLSLLVRSFRVAGDSLKLILKGALGVSMIAAAITLLTPSLVLLGITMASLSTLALPLVIYGLSSSFSYAGRNIKSISVGSLAVGLIAAAITLLTPPLVIMSLTLASLTNLALPAIIIGLSKSFIAAGKSIKKIALGAAGITMMAISLAVIVPVFASVANLMSDITAGIVAGALTAMIIPFLLAGKFHNTLKMGAVSVLGMGIATMTLIPILETLGRVKFDTVMSLTMLVFSMTALFVIAGALKKQIREGADSVEAMGWSLATFIPMVWSLSGSDKKMKPEDLRMNLMSVSMFMAFMIPIYVLAGEMSKPIRKGALSMSLVGLSLMTFIPTMITAALIGSRIDYAQLGMMLIVIIGVYAIAGLMSSGIIKGSLAMGLVGLTMIPLSYSIMMMGNAISKMSLDTAIGFGLIMASIVGTYILVGLAAPLIMPGIGTILGIGATMIILSIGVSKLINAGVNAKLGKETGEGVKAILMGIAMAIIPLVISGAVLALTGGIFAVMLMAAAVVIIAYAVDIFMKKAKGWDNQQADQLKYVIKTMGEGFATVGSKKGMSKVLGVSIGLNAVTRGAISAMFMASTLTKLANGMEAWKNLKLDKKEVEKITENIMRVLDTIPAVFAAIGLREKKSNTLEFRGVKIWNPFGKGDIEAGVDSVRHMGSTLLNLSKGIKAWSKMTLTPEETNKIATNVDDVLTVMHKVFAVIGQSERGSRSGIRITDSFKLTMPWAKGDVEIGINAVRHIGDTLTSLVDGVKAWLNFNLTDEQLQTIVTNVSSVLNSIPAAFAAIGVMDQKKDVSFFGLKFKNPFSKGDITRGVQTVTDVSKTMTELADAIVVWKPDGEKGITKELSMSIADNIRELLKSLMQSFADVGRMDKETKGMFGFGSGDITKGIKILKSISPTLDVISDLVSRYKRIKGDIGEKIRDTGAAVVDLVTEISKIPKKFNMKANKTTMDDIANYNETIVKVSDSTDRFKTIVSDLIGMTDPFKKFVDQFERYTKSMKEYHEDINAIKLKNLKEHNKTLSSLMKVSTMSTIKLAKNVDVLGKFSQIATAASNPQMYISGAKDFAYDFTREFAPGNSTTKPKTNVKVSDNRPSSEKMLREENRLMMEQMQQMNQIMMQQQKTMSRLLEFLQTGTLKMQEVD